MTLPNPELSSTRRDKLHIVTEILVIAKKGAPKTRIMYGANTSFTRINEYLSFMLETRLLKKSLENNQTIYKATEKGLDVLRLYCQIIELLNEENDCLGTNVKMPPAHLLCKQY